MQLEARWLLKKELGDEYQFVSAYNSKALNWSAIKVEGGAALSRFSIFLASGKNTMEGSQYSSKFDQPDNIQKLIFKLPYNMRERWRRVVDDIMELQRRPVKFDDVATFIDRETRIASLRKDLGELENGYGHPVWQGSTDDRVQEFRR